MLIIVTFILNAALNFALGLAVAAGLGPEAYGRFSVAFAGATALAMLAFDWLRLSATRHYSEDSRVQAPGIRSSLDAAYAGGGALIAGLALALSVAGFDAGLGGPMIWAIALVAISYGLFDYYSALLRARFRNRAYAGLIILKNLLGFSAMVGAAFWSRDALVVMGVAGASVLVATLALQDQTRDRAPLRLARADKIALYLRYGAPIIVANLFYQAIVLANRSLAAGRLGFAEAGELSLATDVTLRLMLAAGAALDIYLFQLAVRKKATQGEQAGQAQMRANILWIFAAFTLICAGYMADMPAFAALVAPEKFRESFGGLAFILAPGVALFCLGQFCLNPIFQLAGRTGGVFYAGLACAAFDLGWLTLFPPEDARGYALAHSAGLTLGFFFTLGLTWPLRACWPRLRDVAGVAAAGFCAAVAMSFTRDMQPALFGLLATAGVGVGAFGLVLLALDPGGLFRPGAARLMARLPVRTKRLFNRAG
jgi:O-antigen/teichoic acid export membrane protein